MLKLRTPFGGGKSHNLAALRHALGSRKALEVLPEAAGLPDAGKVDVAECHWGQGHFIFVSQFNLHSTIQIPALWPLRPRLPRDLDSRRGQSYALSYL